MTLTSCGLTQCPPLFERALWLSNSVEYEGASGRSINQCNSILSLEKSHACLIIMCRGYHVGSQTNCVDPWFQYRKLNWANSVGLSAHDSTWLNLLFFFPQGEKCWKDSAVNTKWLTKVLCFTAFFFLSCLLKLSLCVLIVHGTMLNGDPSMQVYITCAHIFSTPHLLFSHPSYSH